MNGATPSAHPLDALDRLPAGWLRALYRTAGPDLGTLDRITLRAPNGTLLRFEAS